MFKPNCRHHNTAARWPIVFDYLIQNPGYSHLSFLQTWGDNIEMGWSSIRESELWQYGMWGAEQECDFLICSKTITTILMLSENKIVQFPQMLLISSLWKGRIFQTSTWLSWFVHKIFNHMVYLHMHIMLCSKYTEI